MKICFTGGGTAGHIMPALAIIDEIRHQYPGCDFIWIGRHAEQERMLIEAGGCRWVGIPTGKFRRYASFHNFLDLFRIIGGCIKSFAILMKEKPDILFSKGGFVSVPPIWAARILKIPSITHESDASPGLSTRLNAPSVRYICVPYAEAAGVLAEKYPSKIVVTGNPIRKIFLQTNAVRGRRLLNLPPHEALIVVLGGSQGAAQINSLIDENLDSLTQFAYIYHQRGKGNLPPHQHDRYIPVEFVGDELADILSAADIVISRAGAGAISELTALGKAMVLIPLGSDASRGDQILNAARLEKAGAAQILLGKEASGENLIDLLMLLFSSDKERIKRMEKASAAIGNSQAGTHIAELIIAQVKMSKTIEK